jgi:hypothetical protein
MIGGDLNTMGHGIARLSPYHCNDRLRWATVGQTEAEFWQHNLFDVSEDPKGVVRMETLHLSASCTVCQCSLPQHLLRLHAECRLGISGSSRKIASIAIDIVSYAVHPVMLLPLRCRVRPGRCRMRNKENLLGLSHGLFIHLTSAHAWPSGAMQDGRRCRARAWIQDAWRLVSFRDQCCILLLHRQKAANCSIARIIARQRHCLAWTRNFLVASRPFKGVPWSSRRHLSSALTVSFPRWGRRDPSISNA